MPARQILWTLVGGGARSLQAHEYFGGFQVNCDGGWVGGWVGVSLLLHISCLILLHASLTENDACKYQKGGWEYTLGYGCDLVCGKFGGSPGILCGNCRGQFDRQSFPHEVD